MTETTTSSARNTAKLLFFIAMILLGTGMVLRLEGRRWWCNCQLPDLCAGSIWSEHCSQHFLDPYSFTHFEHGLIAFTLLNWLFPKRSILWRTLATLIYACGWEMLENSPFIIERYRAGTVSLHYVGDSIINSIGDILCCLSGFYVAKRVLLRPTLALFVGLELLLLFTVRDNLTLNILMLTYPIDSIRQWQMLAVAP